MYKCHGILSRKPSSLSYLVNRFNTSRGISAFNISKEVSNALSKGMPVVALESTVITHGLPYPQNLNTAQEMEKIVKENNAIPATIGVIHGKVHVGINSEDLEKLSIPNSNYVKISRRDLPYALSKGLTGGTTVAGTMVIAHRAGIPIFATGGIGGVHRGAETSMDISADLYELSQTPMTVISAGVKSILDIGRTLEYLETLGVCVAAFGPSKDFPAFFTPRSGFTAACNVDSYAEAARLIDSRDELQLQSGVLLAVAVPDEFSSDGLQTETVIDEALKDAKEKRIQGKGMTPFILKRVGQLSNGASLRANIGLLKNNALVGSRIAVHLSDLKRRRSAPTPTPTTVHSRPFSHLAKAASSPRPVREEST